MLYKNFLLVICIFLLITKSEAQSQLQGQSKIDSLINLANITKTDSTKVRYLNEISNNYIILNPKLGVEYGEKCLELAQSIKWKEGIFLCYDCIGINYEYGLNDPNSSGEYFRKAYQLSKELKDTFYMSTQLNNIAGNYLALADFPNALEYYFKSLAISEKLKDTAGLAFVIGNIGIVYNRLGQPKNALKYFRESLEYYNYRGDKPNAARTLNNIGNVYLALGEIDKALDYNKRALKAHRELESILMVANDLASIGYTYLFMKNYSESEKYFSESYRISKELNNINMMGYNLKNLGALHYGLTEDSILKSDNNTIPPRLKNKQKNLNKSIEYFTEAEALSKQMSDLHSLQQIYKNLHLAYESKGITDSALKYYKEYTIVKDSIFSDDKREQIAAIEKAREEDVNRITIEKQQVELEAKESENQFIIIIALGTVLFIVTLLLVFYFQRRKSELLLYNVLPVSIAKRLKKKEHPISDNFTQASIIFIDIVGFTAMSKNSDPTDIVQALNKIFTHYDSIAEKYGLEKIKTIGDCYMAAAGLPVIQEDNTRRAALMALDVRDYMIDYYTDHGYKLDIRIGLDCGPVVAGVIGEKKFIYDMWSDAVNTASRMESTGKSGYVHVSERFKEAVESYDEFEFIERDEIDVKGKGKMKTYFLERK